MPFFATFVTLNVNPGKTNRLFLRQMHGSTVHEVTYKASTLFRLNLKWKARRKSINRLKIGTKMPFFDEIATFNVTPAKLIRKMHESSDLEGKHPLPTYFEVEG